MKLKKIFLHALFVLPLLGLFSLFVPSVSHATGSGFGSTEWIGGVGVAGAEKNTATDSSLITTVKKFINWTLGILSLIALVILLWGGFQMLTAAGDETKFKKGWTILKQAAIALAFIGLSWMIVSLIFYVITESTK